jgi:N-acetylneuraminic acid mutarotase
MRYRDLLLRWLVVVSTAAAAACGADDSPVSIEIDPRWSLGVPLPVGLAGGAAAEYRGAIVVAGGENESGPSRAVFQYVPGAASWERLGDLPDFRVDGRLVVVDGTLYMVGGFDVRPPGNAYFPAHDLWIYQPATDAWLAGAPLPDNRDGDAAGVPGRIVVVGGGFGSAEHGGEFPGDSVALYDVVGNRWQYGAPIGTPRTNPMSVAVGSRVHVFGGRLVGIPGPARPIEIYDAGTNTWSVAGTFPSSYDVIVGQAHARSGGRVHFFGGLAAVPGAPAVDIHMRYDLATAAWEALPLLPTPRSRAAAVAIDGRIFVIGGLRGPRNLAGAFTGIVEVWSDPG